MNQLAQHATPPTSVSSEPNSRTSRAHGNHTLAAVVGMLSEITSRHVALGYRETRRPADEVAKEIQRVIRAYGKLISLVEDRKGPEAEAFWRRHMNAAMKLLLADTGAAQDVVD